MKYTISALIFLVLGVLSFQKEKLPEGFVYVEEIIPDIEVELRYFSSHNFVGDTIEGYHTNRLVLTLEAAQALKRVQEELLNENLCLKVYDGYRPQQAVNHFVHWARQLQDTINKEEFYPEVKKNKLFQEGYIASKSGHSRGSTVDLTIIDANTLEPLDMGSPFDFFGPSSWVAFQNITAEQRENRMRLQRVMQKHGFRGYSKEWWHFTLRNEPFPDTYFNFPID